MTSIDGGKSQSIAISAEISKSHEEVINNNFNNDAIINDNFN